MPNTKKPRMMPLADPARHLRALSSVGSGGTMKISVSTALICALLAVDYGAIVPLLLSSNSLVVILIGAFLGALPVIAFIGWFIEKELDK